MVLQRNLLTNMTSIFRSVACYATLTPFLAVGFIGFPATGSAGLIAGVEFGSASDYAVLGIGGLSTTQTTNFEVYQSGTVVNGNVGVGPYSVWTHDMDAHITGRLDYDPTGANTTKLFPVTGTIDGGIHTPNMAGVVADALSADHAAAALTPTQTFTSSIDGTTIMGNSGLNVIRLTNADTLKTTLTVQGPADAEFVFQVQGVATPGHNVLTLSGVQMSLTGGVTANNILWDLTGSGGDLSITSGGAVVDGTFLAPDRNIIVDNATVNGSVIGGGYDPVTMQSSQLSIHSTSTINFQQSSTFSTVPEPATLFGAATGTLFGLGCAWRRRRGRATA